MKFYAHTARSPDRTRLPESSGKWQPLAVHLRNVADLMNGAHTSCHARHGRTVKRLAKTLLQSEFFSAPDPESIEIGFLSRPKKD